MAVGQVLGAVTIGQSPRVDLIPEMRFVMAQDVRILEAGALDGLTLAEVEELAPERGDDVLVTRMADGTAVRIAEKHIISRMQEKIDELVRRGADVVALVCTGEFPQFQCNKLLVYPQKVLFHAVAGIAGMAGSQEKDTGGRDSGGQSSSGQGSGAAAGDGSSDGGQSSGIPAGDGRGRRLRLGVLVPDSDQIPQAAGRWKAVTSRLRISAVSPYGYQWEIEERAHFLRQEGVDLIVMDCIGYTLAMKYKVQQITGAPVMLARSVLARALAELM